MTYQQNTTDQPPRRSRLGWLAMVAVVTMLVAASNAATAGAQTDPDEPVDVAVASYASDYNVTHQEAQRRLDRIQPLQEFLASIRSLETTRLAGWGIDHTGTFTGWVWLTGDQPPSAAAARIADAHTDVEIRIGATHTYAELLVAKSAVLDASTANQVTGGTDPLADVKRIVTYTGIDMRNNAIRIGIDPSIIDPLAVSDQALHDKSADVAERLDPTISVNFVVEDGRGIASEASFGGGQQIGGCTSGFAARKNGGGAYGIITAGHCGDAGPNDTTPQPMHSVSLPLDYGWASVNADAQFHTIPTGASHELRDDYRCLNYNDGWCDVTDDIARDDMSDDYVCHTGRRSGITCGTVVETDYQPTYSGACKSSGDDVTSCNHVFVKVEGPSLRSCRGDSGGSWYRYGIAYGIHMGSNSGNTCDASNIFAFFSAIIEVENFLNVEVLTTGTVTIP